MVDEVTHIFTERIPAHGDHRLPEEGEIGHVAHGAPTSQALNMPPLRIGEEAEEHGEDHGDPQAVDEPLDESSDWVRATQEVCPVPLLPKTHAVYIVFGIHDGLLRKRLSW